MLSLLLVLLALCLAQPADASTEEPTLPQLLGVEAVPLIDAWKAKTGHRSVLWVRQPALVRF
ncbi:MAG: hypothetical protein ACFE0O_00760 [Opitutales bacterium]